MRIQYKLAFGFLAVSLIALSGLSTLLIRYIHNFSEENATNQLRSLLSAQAARSEVILRRYLDQSSVVAELNTLRAILQNPYTPLYSLESPDAPSDVLDEILSISDRLSGIALFDSSRRIVAHAGVPIPDDPNLPWPISEPRLGISSLPSTLAPFRVVFSTTSPITDRRRIIGWIRLSFKTNYLEDVVRDYSLLGASGETLLARRSAAGLQFLFSPRKPLRSGSEAPITQEGVWAGKWKLPLEQVQLGQREIQIMRGLDYDGSSVLLASRSLDPYDLIIGVKLDESEIYAEESRLVRASLVWIALVGLLSVGAGLLLARYFAQRLTSIRDSAHRIKRGDLNHRAAVSGSDELAELATALNAMAANLIEANSSLEQRVHERTRDLEQLNQQLTREVASRKESEDRFRLAIEAAPNAMLMVDAAGVVVLANQQASRLLGYSKQELEGMCVDTFVPEEVRSSHASHRDIFLQHAQPRTLGTNEDLFLLKKDGSRAAVEIGLNPIQYCGDTFILCSVVDVTERKRVEEVLRRQTQELERSNREMEQFAYAASHDMKEPLRMVGSFAELLQKNYQERLDSTGREYLDFVASGARRMQTLIDALLRYSGVGRGKTEMEIVDTNEILEDVRQNLSITIEENRAAFHIDALPELHGNRIYLSQLFQNIISNAIKFRKPHTDPVVRVLVKRERDLYHFIIADNGIGLDPRFAHKIFNMFQRLHPQEAYEGAGIGLAICKKIIELHRGTIWIESQPNEGTEVHFTLPVPRIPAPLDLQRASMVAAHAV